MKFLRNRSFAGPALHPLRLLFCGILYGLSLALPAQAQDSPNGQIPARTELHSFQSLTISDAAFLKGQDAGTPVTIAGELRVALGTGRMPVVVLVHGSSGIGSNTEVWARQFNLMGISAFILDSFTGRGLTVVGPRQTMAARWATGS